MKDFLKDNTQIREDILNQKLFFDLKEASARRKIHLKTFLSNVDIDGFDIIIDNNEDLLLKCQVKSRIVSKTKYFELHRIMLCPKLHWFDSFEFFRPNGCPMDYRGIIQIDGDVVGNKIVSKYYYLDIYLLRMMELGVFKLTNQSKTKAEELLNELRTGAYKRGSKIDVLQSLFFPVKDTQALLELMGFHSVYNSNFTYNALKLSQIVSNTHEKKFESDTERVNEMKGHWNYINYELSGLVDPNSNFKTNQVENNYFQKRRKDKLKKLKST